MSESCFSQDFETVMSYADNDSEGDLSEEILEDLENLYNEKLNLNDLTESDCLRFVFLTDFEKQSLLYYVNHNKPVFSIYELQYVLGLPLEKAKLLSQFLVVEPSATKKTISHLIDQGKHVFASNISFQNIDSELYKDYYKYEGGPGKEVFRYRFSSQNSLFYGFTLKKDMGESFSVRKGFDSRSFYLQLRNRGLVSNLVVGDYKLSIGQGLTIAQGGFSGNSIEQSGGVQSNVLSKHSSTSEYMFSRGCGVSFTLKKFQITPFVSHRKLDGKIMADSLFPFSISQTGYHRTRSEIAVKNQIQYSLIGVHSQYNMNHLRIGFACLQHSFSLDSVCSEIRNATVFYNFIKRHLRLYGEFATDQKFRIATIHGLQYALSDDIIISNSFRCYQDDYQSFMSSAVGRNSSAENEVGFVSNLKVALNSKLTMYLENDFFKFPKARTRLKMPSHGNSLRAKLSYKTYNGYVAEYQYSYLTQTAESDGDFFMSKKQSHKFNVSSIISSSIRLKFSLQSTFQNRDVGYLLYGDLVYKPTKSASISFRFAQFDASYDNRLYAWEDDVSYSFSSSAYFYSGTYWYLMTKLRLGEHIEFQTKIAQTNYFEKYDLPESYELYENNRKVRVNLMLQFVF